MKREDFKRALDCAGPFVTYAVELLDLNGKRFPQMYRLDQAISLAADTIVEKIAVAFEVENCTTWTDVLNKHDPIEPGNEDYI